MIAGEVVVAAPIRPRSSTLDGLRGIAALVVVAHHLLLCFGWPSDPYASAPSPVPAVRWLMTYTPLHALWAGPEAVVVFFVLSGYVLAGTDLSTPQRTAGYAAKRVVRLYVPVCGAVALAGVARAVFPRRSTAANDWLTWHAGGVSPGDHLRATALVLGDAGRELNSVLWSLDWEVRFSALLPLVTAVFLVATGRRAAVVIASLLGVSVVISVCESTGLMLYLPMFLAGVLAAGHADEIGAWFRRGRRATAGVAMAVGTVLLTSRWTLNPPLLVHGHAPQRALQGIDNLLEVAGACLLVLGAANLTSRRRLLDGKAVQHVGRRSFSLYLVHEPVIVSVAQVLRPQARPAEFVLVSIVAAVALAEAFHRCVERPAMRLAGRTYRRVTASKSEPATAS